MAFSNNKMYPISKNFYHQIENKISRNLTVKRYVTSKDSQQKIQCPEAIILSVLGADDRD